MWSNTTAFYGLSEAFNGSSPIVQRSSLCRKSSLHVVRQIFFHMLRITYLILHNFTVKSGSNLGLTVPAGFILGHSSHLTLFQNQNVSVFSPELILI